MKYEVHMIMEVPGVSDKYEAEEMIQQWLSEADYLVESKHPDDPNLPKNPVVCGAEPHIDPPRTKIAAQCPVCGYNGENPIIEEDEHHALLKCPNCKHQFSVPLGEAEMQAIGASVKEQLEKELN